MKSYNDFSSVDELRKYYHLITEDQNEPENNKKYNNIFKHIIIFTNDRNPKNNKTLKNIYDAVKNLESVNCEIIPKLHIFVAANVDAEEMQEKIKI